MLLSLLILGIWASHYPKVFVELYVNTNKLQKRDLISPSI